mgnify:CR=1 FL=1
MRSSSLGKNKNRQRTNETENLIALFQRSIDFLFFLRNSLLSKETLLKLCDRPFSCLKDFISQEI